jgi:hypothetical protein
MTTTRYNAVNSIVTDAGHESDREEYKKVARTREEKVNESSSSMLDGLIVQ